MSRFAERGLYFPFFEDVLGGVTVTIPTNLLTSLPTVTSFFSSTFSTLLTFLPLRTYTSASSFVQPQISYIQPVKPNDWALIRAAACWAR